MNAPARPPLILTDAQYEDMARRGAFAKVGRVELRGGVLTPMSPVHLSHSNAVLALILALNDAIGRAGAKVRLNPEISVAFGGGFQPTADIVVWDPAAAPPDLDGPIPGRAAKLVIEVADASLGDDLGEKLGDYAAAGLPEYWVVDIRGRLILRHERPSGREYKVRAPVHFGEPAAALTLALTVETAAL
jgi:Uma2 family endonuclease